MDLRAARHLVSVFALFVAASCASSATPEPATVPVTEQAATDVLPPADLAPHHHTQLYETLQPPQAAVKASENVELTGTEMGTMWTFENPPLDYWEETYGFRPSADWLEHVRLASVRYGRGCSASFVSPNGLVITNNHCARGCVDAVSTEEADYLVDGFYAATREEELLCPRLYLDQLVDIEDITAQVHGAAQPGMDAAAVATAQQRIRTELDEQCEARTGLACQVVPLFYGGQYGLYKFRRYSTVKLVFTPEMQAGFFGGDQDNFTYPRYDLDITFVRAYEDDGVTPAGTPDYFEWDSEGAQEGELVFVTGNPGGTSRQIAVSEYLYEREVRHPTLLDFFDSRVEVLHAITKKDPARGRVLKNATLGYENNQKRFRGQLNGLRDLGLTAHKIRWESEFRQKVEEDPELAARYGNVWEELEAIHTAKARMYPKLYLYDSDAMNRRSLRLGVDASAHFQLASRLVRYIEAMTLPEHERPGRFRGDSLILIRSQIEEPGPMHEDQSARMLAGRLAIAQRWLPPGDPLVSAVLQGETPDDAATRLVTGSRVADPEYRSDLIASGLEGVSQSDDPLVLLAREMVALSREVEAEWSQLDSAEGVQTERFAKALFAVFGTDLPPDATFTLRITDGVVKRYEFNGTFAPAQTTLYGLYARAAEFENEMPWKLAPAFEKARHEIDMSVPINFVSTNDITGGNSGSPLIDRDGRFVGIAFDGNVESFPNEFLFASKNGRTVSVHSAGITEALRTVYEADELLQEILEGAER
jgi:hypothetical protein